MGTGTPVEGGPPPEPFTDPQQAKRWLETLLPPQPDPILLEAEAVRVRLRQAFEKGGQEAYEQELQTCNAERRPEPPRAYSPAEIHEPRPAPLIWGKGLTGSVLQVGEACLLAGEGGIAKTAFALQVAVSLAAAEDGETADLGGGLQGSGRSVLFGSYEDCLGELNWRTGQLVTELDNQLRTADQSKHYSATLESGRLRFMDLSGWPLYGAAPGASYNSRPMALPGWRALWDQADECNAGLLVVDPVLAAYPADQSSNAAVTEFLFALVREARRHHRSLLLVAHSNKAARGGLRGGPGTVSGTTAWWDRVRGVLALNWAEPGPLGELELRIAKANRGPERISIAVNRLRSTNSRQGTGPEVGEGPVIGLTPVGRWLTDAQRRDVVDKEPDKT